MSGDEGLEAILSDPKVHIVVVVLPVHVALPVRGRSAFVTDLPPASPSTPCAILSLSLSLSPSAMPRAPPAVPFQVVQRALAAGKHVIEEKPVSGTVAAAAAAIRAYRAPGSSPSPLWLVAENYRYEAVFLEAAKASGTGRVSARPKRGAPCMCARWWVGGAELPGGWPTRRPRLASPRPTSVISTPAAKHRPLAALAHARRSWPRAVWGGW